MVGTAIAGITTLANYGLQKQTNIKNEELLRESWARDDNAMQRARKDAEAAGFSPLAAIGNSLGNTNPTAMNAPEINTSGVTTGYESAKQRQLENKKYKLEKTMVEQQIEDAKEGTRGIKLDNDLKEQTFNTKVMQEVATLSELRKKNDITDAQYWAYLADMKARGITNDFIDTMIKQKEAGYDATEQTANKINADLNTQEQRLSSRANRIAQEALNNVGIKWGGKNGEVPIDKALEEYWSKENINVREKTTAAIKAVQEALEEQGKADKEFWSKRYTVSIPTYGEDGTLYYKTVENATPKEIEQHIKMYADHFTKMYTNKIYEKQGGDWAAAWKGIFSPILQVLN